jgi:hypothetical protein
VNTKNFFPELKRRNVYKVAVAYAVVAWLLIQVATQVFPFFEIPNWAAGRNLQLTFHLHRPCQTPLSRRFPLRIMRVCELAAHDKDMQQNGFSAVSAVLVAKSSP